MIPTIECRCTFQMTNESLGHFGKTWVNQRDRSGSRMCLNIFLEGLFNVLKKKKILAKRVIFIFYRNTLQFLHIYTPHKTPNPPNYLDSKHKQQSPLWPQTEIITRAFLTCHCFQNTYSQFISLDQVLFSIGWEYF